MTQQMVTPKKSASKKSTPKNARIFFILDRSGSMSTIADETIGGFNAFVTGQKELPGKATLTLVQFDHEYNVIHDNVKLASVPELTRDTFKPRGMTALYDAVGLTIANFKHDNPKNTKTIVAILTDGQENASKEYSYSKVKQLIDEVQGEHSWDVLFIGANMDSKSVAQSMGIKASNTTNFDYSKTGAMDAMATMNFAASSMRGVACAYADGTVADANNLDMTKLYVDVKAKLVKTAPDAHA